MSVIGPSCALPSETSPGCGCATKDTTGNKFVGAATVPALAAAACTACCVLPFALPASVLALAGGSIAVLDHAHGWMTKFAIAVVICAWAWVAWQRKQSRRQITRVTLALMILATLLTTIAASWSLLEPVAFHTLGIVKRKASHINE